MKKLFVALGGFLLTSSVMAASLSVCTGQPQAADGVQITGTAGFTAAASGSTGFVINAFKPKCSANVYASIEQDEIALGVAAGSKKGKNLFTGGTGGGAVKAGTTQFPNGVAQSDTDSAATTALAEAISS